MEWPGRRGIRTSYIRACRDLPGRAAHGERERYLAKGWLGSDRVGKERSQLPAATTTATNPRRPGRQRPELQPGQQTGPARTPSATVAQPPRGRPFPLDRLFQERSHRRMGLVQTWVTLCRAKREANIGANFIDKISYVRTGVNIR